MANSTSWVKHIEAYVDSSSTPTQQGASLDAIAALLNNGILSIEALVKEMEMYLTTTDNIIRARGILLLAEALTRLASKPLDDATVRSLIKFFTDRLGDWKALRGALVGCLALIRRKSNVGMVTSDEAKAVVQSYLQNLQVQSLGQHDRKLCFELLECLLNRYPRAVADLGDDLVYGICEAIDGEKDPQCLIITFHVVEVLAQLFPDPSGPVANFAEELFEILGCYFPIHFTHPKDEEVDAKRDDLSKALMLAFTSTPFFEPFAIPLLLEKLSSNLSSAKIDSLRYLSHCSMKYGADRMGNHAQALWTSLKDTFSNSLESYVPLDYKLLDDINLLDNEVISEALLLLQKLVAQNDGLFLNLIVADGEINTTIKSITSFKYYADISDQNKLKLHSTGLILSVSARASIASCNRVFGSFFLYLMEALGISKDNHLAEDCNISGQFNYGALYLCVELLAACRQLVMDAVGRSSVSVSANETWRSMIQSFSHSLTEVFSYTLLASGDNEIGNAYIRMGVKGLQTLATFPENFLSLSKSTLENILKKLMSIITLNADKISLWTLSLRALVGIGSFIDSIDEAEKASSFKDIVVLKIASLLVADDSTLPLSSKLEAMFEIGTTNLDFMLIITQGLEDAVYSKLSEAYAHGIVESAESGVGLLECYSNKLLPWFDKLGGFKKIPLQFAINVWDQVEKSIDINTTLQQRELLDAAMTAMKLAVANCCEDNQTIIIQKACHVLKSSSAYPSKNLLFDSSPTKFETSQFDENSKCFTCRDEWIISLFSSVIIALRPQTRIPDLKVVLNMLMTITVQGHVAAAQALGSITNKLPLRVNAMDTYDCCNLEEALDIIFSTAIWNSKKTSHLKGFGGKEDDVETGVSDLKLSNGYDRSLKIHTIAGLAWIGKGLLMRGHEKVKDITMPIWNYLLSDNDIQDSSLRYGLLEEKREQDELPLMKSAADAFHIFMSDTESCLNRRFHATIRPLYKQRFFSTMVPIVQSSVLKTDSLIARTMLYRAFAHIISETPISAVSSQAKKLIPLLLNSLSLLKEDISNKDITYSLLLVLSGLLTDKSGHEAVLEDAHIIVGRLVELVPYPHAMLVRETAIQCLVAMSVLPHARIYPMRTKVLRAVSKALDDPKRAVRQEAVRCRQAWASIAS